MIIHHLNCGCMCPLGGALYDGFSKGVHAHLACHCLLLETQRHGLVLVDTGFGTTDMRQPRQNIPAFFRLLNNIQHRESLTALAQVKALGFQAEDVRHIVLTHLDFDHAGGLTDFPQAQIHLLQREIDTAQQRHSWLTRERYRPGQWQAVSGWQGYAAEGEQWFGFDAVTALRGLPPEILLIPLAGHTLGHAGVAIQHSDGWLLHGGDAWFYRGEIGQPERHCTPGLRFYQWMMAMDNGARRVNQQRLRELALTQGKEVRLFCSHDAQELRALQEG
ncbi:MBL fold metallo-hydrolase [Kosakonia pseudosacchari]|uniref:MBL fold metallo-hydrolase n=1 Tax=Kosakonia pseudosacchari TaxID=1646340 RepID=A0ABX4IXE3_9ENTR|nr:MBL fold metallo-hydrolase [Kosakonia pseudosacchari]PDO90418.1 MBL fold metallo-hydrolase [Kosakonia pseudosacchari]